MHRDDGLKVQDDFVVLQCLAEFVLGGHGLNGAVEHVGLEDLDAVAPGSLGAMQGEGGILEQLVGVGVLGRADGYAVAGGSVDYVSVNVHGRGENGPDAAYDVYGPARAGVLKQQDEFVAAEAGHGVGFPHGVSQAAGDFLEQFVARQMAQTVIDLFEIVQIQEHHRQQFLIAPGPGHLDP